MISQKLKTSPPKQKTSPQRTQRNDLSKKNLMIFLLILKPVPWSTWRPLRLKIPNDAANAAFPKVNDVEV